MVDRRRRAERQNMREVATIVKSACTRAVRAMPRLAYCRATTDDSGFQPRKRNRA
jgi:hypothetical protein